MPVTYKRVIEETASDEIYNDDWFLKDSVLHDTTKVQPSVIKEYVNQGMATSQDLTDAIETEATARTNADTALGGRIDDEATARTTAINNEAYYRSMSDIVLSEDIAEPYDTTKSYVVGDIVSYNLYIYRCTGATTGTWDESKWEQVTVDELIEDITVPVVDVVDDDNDEASVVDENGVAHMSARQLDTQVYGGSLVNEDKVAVLDSLTALGTASGAIASFSDGANLPMPTLKIGIEPQQDLHGYDHPWVGGSGKNKLQVTTTTQTINGVTFTVNSDGTVVANGTSSDSTMLVLNVTGIILPSGNYKISSGLNNTSGNNYFVCSNYASGTRDYTNDGEFPSDGSTTYRPSIYIVSGITLNNVVFKPMIRLSSVTDATFAPYSNICPISGWAACNVVRTGKNLVNWKWNTFNDGKMEIFLKGGTYTLSAESTLTNGNAYIRGTKPNGEYVSREELGLTDWGASSTSGVYYGGGGQQTYTFSIPNCGAKIEFGKLNNNGTISAQLEFGSSASDFEPYNGATYTIDLDGTRYGGTLDVVSGLLTVYPNRCNLGDLNWVYASTQKVFYCNLPTDALNVTNKNGLCEGYKPTSWETMDSSTWSHLSNGEFVFSGNLMTSGRCALVIKDLNYTDATTFKSAVNGIYILYPLATPTTIQLTPTQVKSLLGSNNVWADCGEIIEAKYCRDLTTTINYILEQLNA